ncbi:MFS transporter [Methanobacterium paludis]|uniref:Major facilitator superfamily MFS_1 n=1 Tax=Methanobacterium paludis (strain DSM 25820 / JCM 18151 / SWAN1) TaxID=868131 RepID=F6D7T9_METPW|nr:MFS transporter [Methanobacterium paludis]AEG17777.1 major facilitator superfamily MFS_1 [Methanobacterium paludis]
MEIDKTIKSKIKLSLFLLLQGQFVSVIGDTIYEIALGFWVLILTGSPALMGILMATSIIPAIILSPFAGVVVDRYNRKKLMIIMDMIRGATIILVAVVALLGNLEVWMVFVAGIILGICGAFFSPAVNSVLPQMVPKDKLQNANSIFGMAYTGADILGNSIGSILFNLIGAPLMFLINGLSFIISGTSISFAKIPKNRESKITSENFIKDIKESFSFIKNLKGLFYILLIFSISSFLEHIAIVLLIPLFQFTPGLGAAKYGFVIASFSLGMFISMILLSTINVPSSRKSWMMLVAVMLSNLCLIAFALTTEFYLMVILLFISGISESVVYVFVFSSIQSIVPEEMMGKVMALVNTLVMALTPFSMIIGGLLAQLISIKTIFMVCFTASLFVFISLFSMSSVRKFINFDPENQHIEDLY